MERASHGGLPGFHERWKTVSCPGIVQAQYQDGAIYNVGGGVSAPVPVFNSEAEFSDEARRAKYQGVGVVAIIVDAQGNPLNPHVVRTPSGMGLDEKSHMRRFD